MPAFGLNLQVTYIVINVLKSYYFNALTSKMDNYILAFVQDAGEVRLFFFPFCHSCLVIHVVIHVLDVYFVA